MSYQSDIDIKLPLAAEVEDPDVQSVMQRAYNAIHVLNAYTSPVVDYLTVPVDGETSPEESVSFTGRMLHVYCPANCEAGKVISPIGGRRGQWHFGVDWATVTGKTGGKFRISYPFGVTLEDAVAGEDGFWRVLVGLPPAVIAVESLHKGHIGARIYCDIDNGDILIPEDVSSDDIAVGVVVDPGYVLLSWGIGGKD
jgi:hypothetical protein